MTRFLYKYCDGIVASCTENNKQWVEQTEACSYSNQYCEIGDNGQPSCTHCNYECHENMTGAPLCFTDLNLEGTSWKLETMNGESLVPNTTLTLNFTNECSGSGGCNGFNGDFTLKDHEILMYEIGWGYSLCTAEGVMAQEFAYGEALTAAEWFFIDNDVLKLYDENDEEILKYNRQVD